MAPMQTLSMTSDVVGKVKNMRILPNQAIMSVFEAIVNAIQSIEESGRNDGEILVDYYLREWLFDNESSSKTFIPIKDVKITDNGIGFNRINLESFLKSDSTYKYQLGGKGVGRFTWLKVFDKVEVNSVFEEKKLIKCRKFKFILDSTPIKELEEFDCTPSHAKLTEVKLCDLKEEYNKKLPRTLNEFGRKIIEHHINYLVSDNCPKITLRENLSIDGKITSNEIIINDKFNREFLMSSNVTLANISGYQFEIKILCVKIQGEERIPHEVMYSANDRVVLIKKASHYVVDIPEDSLYDLEKKTHFALVILVSSAVLDKHVNLERTAFNIPFNQKEDDLLNNEGVFFETIEDAVTESLEKFSGKYLEGFRAKRSQEISELVNRKAPQYRMIVAKYPERLKRIKPNLSEEKLLSELYRIKNEISNEVKQEMTNILHNNTQDTNHLSNYKERFSMLYSVMNDVTMSELAEYVLHRKLIIELLENSIGMDEDGKFELEKHIHSIVFPMRKDSNEVDYEGQNLWLIDERLSYHSFLTSDIPIDKKSRPDLLIGLDNMLVYSEGKENPYNSFVIVEFKRPMRDDYTENPHEQVMRYVRAIKSGKARDSRGRIIDASDNGRFYIYIVCDLTDPIKEMVESIGYKKMPEGNGYFTFNDNYKAYIEVISFEKVISDAKKRNQILFDKLKMS